MDFSVIITQAAANDLEEIIRYISRDSVRAARRIAADLLRSSESLSEMPHRGNAMRARPGVRRLLRSPYLIIYRIEEDSRVVKVLRFWHGSRNPNTLRLD